MYVYQRKGWPEFKWDQETLFYKLARVRYLQGKLLGAMNTLGFSLKAEAILATLTSDVLKSSEIEGLLLKPEQVRSSIARKLGMDVSGLLASDRHVDGVVEMMLDATQDYLGTLTKDRLFGWHAALFPTGRSGMHKLTVGQWRKDEGGPMQVVSGAMGKERVHFQAPHSKDVSKEMQLFLKWANSKHQLDPVLKAAIAHFWFVTIHPFDDGNGRIARAISDLFLARADETPQRFYSMSAQIRKDRKQYYQVLEKSQKGGLDITAWLNWFLECLETSLLSTDEIVGRTLQKARFWEKHQFTTFNDRQRKMVNKLWDGLDGKLSTSKWAKMTKSSSDTALRDIHDLISKGVLRKEAGGGRSTNYELVEE